MWLQPVVLTDVVVVVAYFSGKWLTVGFDGLSFAACFC
jgi:hypothetical protein